MHCKSLALSLRILIIVSALAVISLLSSTSRADVVGIGDIFPFWDDPETTETVDVPNLPQFGNDAEDPDLPPIPVFVVGGTNNLIGGTATGQVTIDIPSDTDPLEIIDGYIGGNIFGLGQVRVLALNSELQATNSLTVGYEGQGFLDIAAGARVQITDRAENPDTNPGDEIESYDLAFGAWEGSQGFAEIDGFASLLLSGNLTVGHRGQGRIDMFNGARLITVNEASVGTEFDNTADGSAIGSGYVMVDGPGTRWNVGIVPSDEAPPLPTGGTDPGDDSFDGTLVIGRQGRGTVEVVNKGWVRVETDTFIGDEAGSFGKAVVNGADSLLWSLEEMFVGNGAGDATGEVHIDALGEVRADDGTSVGPRGLIELGGGTLITPDLESAGVIRGDGRVESALVLNTGDIRNAAGVANIREKLLFTGVVDNTSNIESVGGEIEFQDEVLHTGANADLVGIDAIFRFQGGLTSSGGARMFLEDTLIWMPAGSSLASSGSMILWAGESTLVGDLDLGATNSLFVELGEPSYGRLEVIGDATIAGEINVSLSDDYLPQIGDSFEIIDADGLTGMFDFVSGGGSGAGFWQASYTGSSAILSYVADVVGSPLLADFDGNGIVNAGDMDVWRDNFGNMMAMQGDGDANGDGTVDGQDLIIIQQEFGMTFPAAPAAGVVPEPSGLALAGLSVAMLSLCRRKRS